MGILELVEGVEGVQLHPQNPFRHPYYVALSAES